MDEKRHFRDTGLAGKLGKIIQLCGITDLDKGKRPYSTILALKNSQGQYGAPEDN